MKANVRRRWAPWVWFTLAPAVIVLLIFFVIPIAYLLFMSFRSRFPGSDFSYTLAQYFEVFTTGYYYRAMWNSVRLGLTVTLLALVLGYPVAYFLARAQSRFKHVVFMVLVAPLLTSIVVRTFGWTIVLGNAGIVNSILIGAGLVERPLKLMYSFTGIVLGMTHIFLPYMVLSIAGVLNQIHPSVEDAARILGARDFEAFLFVTLPLSVPGIIAGSLLIFSLSMGAYVTPRLLGGGNVLALTPEIFHKMLGEVPSWPLGSALALILMLVVLGLNLVYRRFMGKYTQHLTGGF